MDPAMLSSRLDLVLSGKQPLTVFQLAESFEEQVVIDAVSFKQLEEALTLTFMLESSLSTADSMEQADTICAVRH